MALAFDGGAYPHPSRITSTSGLGGFIARDCKSCCLRLSPGPAQQLATTVRTRVLHLNGAVLAERTLEAANVCRRFIPQWRVALLALALHFQRHSPLLNRDQRN